MTSTPVDSTSRPVSSGKLDISRPGSSERRTNLFVKSPPFLGEKARELEKDGLLSGLAPPSQILDGSMPLVELEANRLQDAMSWVYQSVNALQSQSAAVEARISGLQEALQQLNQSPIDGLLDPRGRFFSEVSRVETDTSENSPESPTDQSSGVKRVLLQLERKYAANEKLFEMRLGSLKCELDQRLQRKDLQEYQSQINEQLDSFETKSRVDMGMLGSMIHTESAAERRRIQIQLEVMSKKLASQAENCEQLLRESAEKHDTAFQRVETRLQALEGVDIASHSNRIAGPSPSPGAQSLALSGNESTRLEYLEAAVSQVENRLEALARGSPFPVNAAGQSAGVSSSLLEEFAHRLKQLESRLDSRLSSGGGDEVHHQLMEFHRQQSEMHRQVLDAGVRLGQLELQIVALNNGEKHGSSGDVSQLESRFIAVETCLTDLLQKIENASKVYGTENKKHAASVEELQRQLTLLVKYVGGEPATNEEGNGSDSPSNAVASEWILAWLEERVAALAKDKSQSIDARLRNLEKESTSTPDMIDRLQKLERDLHAIDLKDLRNVRPDLLDYQQHQEIIDSDIMKEVNELKCIVGCIEACIPRETRKAVQLFKRAAGSSEGRPLSAHEFDVESKFLQLREDMQNQIQDATDSLHKGREDMTAVVKGLEKKHELLDARFESARLTLQAPRVSLDSARSDGDDRTRLHSAATNVSREAPLSREAALSREAPLRELSAYPEPSVVNT